MGKVIIQEWHPYIWCGKPKRFLFWKWRCNGYLERHNQQLVLQCPKCKTLYTLDEAIKNQEK